MQLNMHGNISETNRSFYDNLNTTLPDVSTTYVMLTESAVQESGKPGYDKLRLALSLPLLLMATFGNSMAFAVMRRKTMRNTSPGVYFAAIAVADTMTVGKTLMTVCSYFANCSTLWFLNINRTVNKNFTLLFAH